MSRVKEHKGLAYNEVANSYQRIVNTQSSLFLVLVSRRSTKQKGIHIYLSFTCGNLLCGIVGPIRRTTFALQSISCQLSEMMSASS